MRQITVKYAGECRVCEAALEVGAAAIHEKRVGLHCIGCEPTDTEEIRACRQEGADRKADRLEEWAAKREGKAGALEKANEPYRGDTAFNTQPGRIPERARCNRRSEKAWEHQKKADDFRGRAASLRHVRVKGDAERERERQRTLVLDWITAGMHVNTVLYGIAEVVKVNRKTAKVKLTSGNTFNVPLEFLRKP